MSLPQAKLDEWRASAKDMAEASHNGADDDGIRARRFAAIAAEAIPALIAALAEKHETAVRLSAECFSNFGAAANAIAERDDLARLVYVPGLWFCPKCKFELLQSNLNCSDGTVTARDQAGDKCPNCDTPLWRVSERQRHHDVMVTCERFFDEKQAAIADRDAAIATGWRQDAEILSLREEVAALKGALREVKLLALTAGGRDDEGRPEIAVHMALSRMVRIALDAGISDRLGDLRSAITAAKGQTDPSIAINPE